MALVERRDGGGALTIPPNSSNEVQAYAGLPPRTSSLQAPIMLLVGHRV